MFSLNFRGVLSWKLSLKFFPKVDLSVPNGDAIIPEFFVARVEKLFSSWEILQSRRTLFLPDGESFSLSLGSNSVLSFVLKIYND